MYDNVLLPFAVSPIIHYYRLRRGMLVLGFVVVGAVVVVSGSGVGGGVSCGEAMLVVVVVLVALLVRDFLLLFRLAVFGVGDWC